MPLWALTASWAGHFGSALYEMPIILMINLYGMYTKHTLEHEPALIRSSALLNAAIPVSHAAAKLKQSSW